MSLNTRELTLMSAIAIMVAIILAVTLTLFSSVADSHKETLKRLESLETGRAAATAKRFTADDGTALMRCLRIPNLTPEREKCLREIETKIETRGR